MLFNSSKSFFNSLGSDSSNQNDNSLMNDLSDTELVVTNLPLNYNQNELRNLFEQFGEIHRFTITRNNYAFVQFADFYDAKYALESLNGHYFFNVKLDIQPTSKSFNSPTKSIQKCSINQRQLRTSNSRIPFSPDRSFESGSRRREEYAASILCYRATNIPEQDKISHEIIKIEEEERKEPIDWIQIIRDGQLPVGDQKKLDDIFENRIINLSDIPTPDEPDLSIKIPALNNKKSIKKPTDESFSYDNNDMQNFGPRSLENNNSLIEILNKLRV